MKILNTQEAVLTNVEVYTFLTNQAKQYNDQKRKGPANLETIRKEVLQYFESSPAPLSQKPLPYGTKAIPEVIKRLSPYEISKGECIMILNIRPTNVAVLNVIIENMEDRFNADQQQEILDIVIEILGQFPEDDVMQTTEDQ
ncbi:HRDC-like protein [Annulohypoxylon maeteangense]|uniref:HRDC-like protein n=1 Tax=Annulohypoxylon maeteangense TaxID=1927788 RepID=UPI002008DB42|nr:HRDC-like protein [Annulohypoxylon maeteangense]KAI0885366.1 HRDC-like protein [Annulohypoxylon maeteangense]